MLVEHLINCDLFSSLGLEPEKPSVILVHGEKILGYSLIFYGVVGVFCSSLINSIKFITLVTRDPGQKVSQAVGQDEIK